MKVLVNDGIAPIGKKMMEDAGLEVHTSKIAQEELMDKLPMYDAICVRSATKVRKELIDGCPGLKAIGRGGVGLDNIDVDYARSKGIQVHNTPAASSRSVAELAFGHMISVSRSIFLANREMPLIGNEEFGKLKKAYSKGSELEGKTLGVIGMGRIGQETMRIGLGMGMKVIGVDPYVEEVAVRLGSRDVGMEVKISSVSMDKMLAIADYISLHIPFTGAAVLGEAEFAKMKDGVILVNCARGGTVDEDALLSALDSGKVAACGLDVFINEPSPRKDILNHPRISLTPHTGASTAEAQDKIGIELAEKIIGALSG